MTWIDELVTNRKMDKTQAEAAAAAIIKNTIDVATKAGIDAATIADWKQQLDEYGWIDRQEPPSNRIIEADLHVPGKTDLQYDRLAAERWPVALPWMVKEGRFFWSHGKEREALSTSIVGKFTGWRFEKGLPFVQVAWYKTEDSHCELDDLTWQALQDYHAKTGNWGHVSIDWDPNDKTGHKPLIECAGGECWKNHTSFGAKGASWVGDEPACPGAAVVYASNAKAMEVETKPNDERPPKEWFDRCLASVRENGNATDPEKLCGWIWYHGGGRKDDIAVPKDDVPKALSNTNTIKSNTPKHDEAFRNVAISVKSGQYTVEQSTTTCGFCKAFVNGAKSAGASDEIALTLLDTHLKTFLEPEQMTSPVPTTPAPAPAPETEKKADMPPAQPEGAAPPAMDLAKLVEEFAKMKGEMEELKAQMEVMGKAMEAKNAPAPAPAPASKVELAEIKTAAKDLTTIPTVGMEPSTTGTTPAAQPKGPSLEELGKLSLTAEGRAQLARMG